MPVFSALGKLRVRPPWTQLLAILLLFGFGTSLSVILFRDARARERRSLQSLAIGRAHERVELLRREMSRSLEALHSIAALFATRDDAPQASAPGMIPIPVARAEFAAFVRDTLAREPELRALGWTPRVPARLRGAYESAGVPFTEEGAHRTAIRAKERAEYFPIYYIEPVERNQAAAGFDLGSSTVRRAALEQARDTALPVATCPLRLVQENGNGLGFVVYLPLYAGASHAPPATLEQRRRDLTGYASAVFRIEDLLSSTVIDLAAEGFNVRILDETAERTPIYRSGEGWADATDIRPLEGTGWLDMAGRRWLLVLRPTPRFIAGHSNGQPWIILGAGLLLTTLVSGYFYSGCRHTAEIEGRVVERTVQLSNEVAERKRVEESLRLAETNYRSIFENSVEGIFQTTLTGRYLKANLALARIYGYASPDQLIQDLANIANQLYVNPGRRDEFIHQIQRDGVVSVFESQVRRRDGSVIWISENARAVLGPHGLVRFYEGTVVDITARKEAEEGLRRGHEQLEARVRERTWELARSNAALQAEIGVRTRAEHTAAAASRAKTEFLANMSHEIRTPMNAILGYAQILHRDPTLRASQRQAMATILDSGSHLLGLIDDILDLSKIEAGRAEVQPVDFDMVGLVRGVATMFRQRCDQKAVALRVESPSMPALYVHGDERKLRQVLINLLANAVKFTDVGAITLQLTGNAPAWRFEVADTGVGIPAEAQAQILEPFQQASAGQMRGGTGLGLAIARRQIELMGGTLALESSPGAGSRFHFSLTLPPARQAESPAATESRRDVISLAAGHRVRALVVDDVPENRSVLAAMLTQIGCDVVTAEGGEQALAQLATQAVMLPDIAFLDILMPGLDGMQTAQQILGRFGTRVKLVATSASAFSHEQQAYLDAGFHDFLSKPLRSDRLCRCLAELLHVEYDYTAMPEDRRDSEPIETPPAGMGLPPELRSRLQAAAEIYNVTDLRGCISDIERLGPWARPLAQNLRGYIHSYDMSSIARLATDLSASKEPSVASGASAACGRP